MQQQPTPDDAPEENTAVLHGVPAPPDDLRDLYAATLSRARSNAVTRLRRDHREEYEGHVVQYMDDCGMQYTPPLTRAQRAQEKIRQIAEAHGLSVTVDETS